MNRPLIFIVLFCFLTQISEAQLWKQKRYEVFAGLGTTQFFGDIGGYPKSKNILGFKDFSFNQTRFNIHAGLKYKILEDVSVKLNLTYGMLHATDDRGSNESRNMDARTSIFEPALLGEYSFIKSKMEDSYLFNRGRKVSFRTLFSQIDIYAFAGVGGLSYSVKGNSTLVANPNFKNGGFTFVIPVGMGANLLIAPEYNLGMEITGRYAFSDYLDGYTSQYSSSNDVYYFLNFTFCYKIATGRNGWPAFLSKKR
jgi:hypothetical protein